MSGSMSGMWKRGHGRAIKAPPDERGGEQICSTYRYRATSRLYHFRRSARVADWFGQPDVRSRTQTLRSRAIRIIFRHVGNDSPAGLRQVASALTSR